MNHDAYLSSISMGTCGLVKETQRDIAIMWIILNKPKDNLGAKEFGSRLELGGYFEKKLTNDRQNTSEVYQKIRP